MSTAATRTVKRLAASILKVGVSRIRIKPDALDKVETAITREDVKRLIKDGVIYKIPPSTPSRGRWRKVHAQRKKG
ncbi:MAG: 50S ribosomal protein L19e, partial [Thermofilaceae archaeon]